MAIDVNSWLLVPAVSILSLIAALVWYHGLLEGSEGSIETKEKAVHARNVTLQSFRTLCVRAFGIGLGMTGLLALGVFYDVVRGYSPIVFLFGFSAALIALFQCIRVTTQATARIATDYQTSPADGQQSLFQASVLITLISNGILAFTLSVGLWLLHHFYDSNVWNASMRTVTYLGYSFWNDAIHFLPSFQAITVVDCAQTLIFLFIGSVAAWFTVKQLNLESRLSPFIDSIMDSFTSLTGITVMSIVFGTSLFARHPGYPTFSAIVPLFVLGIFLLGLLATRIIQKNSPIVILSIGLLGSFCLYAVQFVTVIGAVSLIAGLMIGLVFQRFFSILSFLPLVGAMACIFLVSGGFLSEGIAWYSISLVALGFAGIGLMAQVTQTTSHLLVLSQTFDPQGSVPGPIKDSSTPWGVHFFSFVLLCAGSIEVFKQHLTFLSHTTSVQLGELQFSTIYSVISSSKRIYDLLACDLSDMVRLFGINLVNPKLLFCFF